MGIYFVFLVSITVLCLFNSLSTKTIIKSVSNPSLNTYYQLQEISSDTLTCPCSTVAIPYEKFISFSPGLHQICSSDLITDAWISEVGDSATKYLGTDWRNRAANQFLLLSKLCQLSNQTVTTAVNEFLLQSFITSNVLTEIDFQAQLEKILDQFYQSTTVYFRHLIDIVNLHMQVDQPFTISFTTGMSKIDYYSIQSIETNTTDNQQQMEFTLSLNSLQDIYSNSTKCFCSTMTNCQTSSVIFYLDYSTVTMQLASDDIAYVIPGSNLGCFSINSLLFSTFECFYSDSICFSTVRNYLQQTYVYYTNYLLLNILNNNSYPRWFNVKPLIYNVTSTKFNRNSSIEMIIKNLFIEQWNPSYSYNNFYQICSPSYCNYQETIQKNSVLELVVIVISIIGGLLVSISFITPYLVTFIIKLISIITSKKQQQNQQNEQVVRSWSERFKLLKEKITVSTYDIVTNLNIFPRHVFANNIDQITAKYYGQLATRLYLLLLIVAFSILTIYTITQEEMMTKEFHKPSFETFNQLIEKYDSQLKCSCSSILSIYGQFIEIEPKFHEICSSSFASQEMINNLSVSLSLNVLTYENRDYRRFISSHIQYLQGLCQISIETIKNSIEQLLSTRFISKNLLLKSEFNEHVNAIIEQTKQNAPISSNAIYLLVRHINFGNTIISRYGTNFKYFKNFHDSSIPLVAKPEFYDNNCSCALQMNCTSQAYFIEYSQDKIPIKGLKIGCTPSESFLVSTLECFYDQSCLNLIKQYTNYTYSLESLSNQSQINLTIGNLVENLFINQWLTTTNYSSYYQQCLPSLCSYTYTRNTNLISVLSFLLGLQGGLSIVLQWTCPRLIQLAAIIKRNRSKRSNIIRPENPREFVPPTEIHMTNESESRTVSRSSSQYLTIILTCLLIFISIALLIFVSIYIAQQNVDESTTQTTISSTNPAMMSNVTTVSTSTLSSTESCYFKFESISIVMPESYISFAPTVIGDFNNDNRLDIAYARQGPDLYFNNNNAISVAVVILGNGNGTFGEPIVSSIQLLSETIAISTAVDFNHDNLLDIVLINNLFQTIDVLLGNGDGTFREIIFAVENCSLIMDIAIGNFDNDDFLDFAVICLSARFINLIYGNANGTSISNTFLDNFTSINVILVSISIADFNNDNYSDILVVNYRESGVHVFLGNGNRSFSTRKMSLIAGQYMSGSVRSTVVVGDFNKDMKQDIIFPISWMKMGLGLLFGYNDGTFDIPIVDFSIEMNIMPFYKATVSDFNNDGYLDFVTSTFNMYNLTIYFRDGNGNFKSYRIFSSSLFSGYNHEIPVDLNGDNYQDLLSISQLNGLLIYLNTGQCDNASAIYK